MDVAVSLAPGALPVIALHGQPIYQCASLTLFVAFDMLKPKGGNELTADFLICLLRVL
jgi:hypothetical protein